MATFYNIDSANARIPEVRKILMLLREQRRELIGLRDRLLDIEGEPDHIEIPADDRPAARADRTDGGDDEARLIRLRMQGTIDQMQAAVTQIDGWGITLRDIESGLIDFPALAMGRQIWLCWRLGEGPIDWWHELDVGFSGRKPLGDLS